jgi:peptide/nickel transport system ATP-binding protein
MQLDLRPHHQKNKVYKSMSLLLQIKNLSIDFVTENETTHALKNINIEINKSETIALVGESGSGKSVTAMSILQLLPSPPAKIIEGEILFEGKNIANISTQELEKIRGEQIAMIFQEPMTSLNPLKKCGEQVSEVLLLNNKNTNKEATQKTIELFEEVKLPNPTTIINRYPHELSGGQKQRVMIAMAIARNPKLLIADEPTTALDVSVQKTILDLLKELQTKYGMAILFITHDLHLVKTFADKTVVMYKGEIVEQGNTSDIFNNPQELYTKGLLHCRPTKTTRVKQLTTVQDVLDKKEYDLHENTITNTEFEHRIETINKETPLFELNNLSCWYEEKKNFFGKVTSYYKAVNDVSLTIKKGETLGLVGESGSGKTTIGKAIAKLTPITKGDILYKGKSIQSFSKQALLQYRKEVQLIFQDPYSSLNPRISIGDAILEPMEVHGLHNATNRKEQVHFLLQKVGLSPQHFNRYPHEFSGGQRQRICIARCLALQPQFIICDESVSALDVSVQAQVLNLLVSLRDEFKLSYLFISHDMQVVKHISDHIAVLNKGQLIEYNTSEQLFASPTTDYAKTLIEL